MSLIQKAKNILEQALSNNDMEFLKENQIFLTKMFEKPENLITLSDAYKYSHPSFYGVGLTKMMSYMESRGGKFSATVMAGLTGKARQFLEGIAITKEDVDEAYEYLGTKYGVFGRENVFDRSKFDYIVEKHGGKLPIRIKAVPEGTVVNTKNVLLTIENLDSNCAWLTNFVESLLLQIWYPITVATLSREVKKIVTKSFLESTDYQGEELENIVQLVLNDFGFRGVSSVESAKIGGMAHLINFRGSDNVVASKYIREYYSTQTIFGWGIPATEHSIMTLRGKAGEASKMQDVLNLFPEQPVACVSDSYDIFFASRELWGGQFREQILARPANAPLIIRPDSGHVMRTLLEVFNILFDRFGFTENAKGYKVLPPQVRVIQGDGVNLESIKEMYAMLKAHKISPENLALGMGGKLLQSEIDRDTQNFAIKACWGIEFDVPVDIIKSPTEMDADGNIHESFKKSKKGIPKLVLNEDGRTHRTVTPEDADYNEVECILEDVFYYGEVTECRFEDVRERARIKDYELI